MSIFFEKPPLQAVTNHLIGGGNMGSPAVSVERLSGTEVLQAVGEMMEYLGHESFDAVMGLEIGGANGLEPLLIGSSHSYDRPVVDADWMGMVVLSSRFPLY